ncbi:MAG: hypothetical protein Q8P84_07830 [Deltaproteobacteria bacterium]|nr:hypothetical protein [Deltaproteobacteria bacterium]
METADLKKTANPREQILGLLVSVALFAMFLRVVYFPKKEAAEQLRSQIHNLILEREALQKFTDALLTTLSRQSATKQPSKGSSDAQILKGEARAIVEEISPFLEKMTTPQFLQGVLVRSMSHIPPKNENGFLKTSFFMEAHGSFRNVTSYLERIAALPVLVSIDNVSLKTTDAKTAQVDVEISGSFFQMEAKVEKK